MAPNSTTLVPTETTGWSRRARRMASLLLGLHLLAILVAPLAVPPASQLSFAGWRIFRPYLEALYLNHGYHFFAPEPGPSHLIQYELTFLDGRKVTGTFPDKAVHQPRLRYHRHFMLTEHLNGLAESGMEPARLEQIVSSYGRHLLEVHGAEAVHLTLIRHELPGPSDVIAGMRLDDTRLYQQRPLGLYIRSTPLPIAEADTTRTVR